MKKIVDIVPYTYLPYHSGGQKSIAQFLDFLATETELTVVGVEDNDFSLVNYKGIPLLKKKISRYFNISLVGKISKLVTKEKPAAIIWEHPYYAWLAFWVRKKTGVKTVIHTHNIEYQRFQTFGKWWWPILRNYERWSFRKADVLFFISPQDRQFAITTWKIDADKCFTIPFGVPVKEYPTDKNEAMEKVRMLHSIQGDEKILLFNGVLDYKPNLDALIAILDEINPLLLAQPSFQYKIIICGKHLPETMNLLKAYADKNVIFAAFVPDIEMYFKAADIFLNPVQSGGGIKTKMVEAIAYGTTVVATETGAVGIEKQFCGNKLHITNDSNWKVFAELVISKSGENEQTPSIYYNHYYWGSIIKNVLAKLAD